LLSGEVTAAGSSVTFDTSIFNNNEVIFSCSDTTFSCTEDTFEYGINEAISHSKDKSALCGSNNISEGFVKLIVIDDTAIEAFVGFIGLNTGNNSRGSMDSLVAVRTPSCGDGFLDTSIGETCDPPGVLQPPNDNVCRDDCTFCGDGIIDSGEDCDDGNDVDGDGCPNDCTITLPDGACCFDDGSCSEETEGDCTGLSGLYQGDGTICSSADCPADPE